MNLPRNGTGVPRSPEAPRNTYLDPGNQLSTPRHRETIAPHEYRHLLIKKVPNKLITLAAGVALPGANCGKCLPHAALKLSESSYKVPWSPLW